MRKRALLILGLPALQVAIALLLIHIGAHQECHLPPNADVAHTPPAWLLYDAITAPLRPLMASYKLVLFSGYPHAIALAMVALWWFWIAQNAYSLLTTGRVALPQWFPARLFINAIFFFSGIVCGCKGVGYIVWVCRFASWHNPYLTPLEWMTVLATGFCFVTWAIVLVVFFGRDIIQSIRELLRTSPSVISEGSSSS